MRKAVRLTVSIVFVLILCVSCGRANPNSNHIEDYSGTYSDKQGTDVIYSSLELLAKEDGTYAVTLGIYRTAELEGTAALEEPGKLHFDCYAPDLSVSGEIIIDDGTATVAVTESNFAYIPAGTEYIFPDGA